MRYEPVSEDDAASLIGEGVHNGLRKGTSALGSSDAWRAIYKADSGWGDAVMFAVRGLEYMGYAVCKRVDEDDSREGSSANSAVDRSAPEAASLRGGSTFDPVRLDEAIRRVKLRRPQSDFTLSDVVEEYFR